ncbi:MAG: PEP-CTERM sorting domain-containing protein [Planctomycetes bacterium]|nr:PEP-CTERM sorting domain-containing protein [Planctomycetota bacterium]
MTKRFLVFFAAILSVSALQVSAFTIPQTKYFSGTPSMSGSLTFNRFDNYGGTLVLQSIDISLTLQASGGYFILDNDNTSPVSGTFEFGANATIIGATDVILKDSSSQDIPAQAAAYHSGVFNLAADVDDDTGDYDPTGPDGMFYNGGIENSTTSGSIGNAFWSGFTGSGTGTYNINFSVTQRASCSGPDYIENQSSPPPSTFGFVTVLYTYEPVPEPATIALLTVGALALLKKRKHSKFIRHSA